MQSFPLLGDNLHQLINPPGKRPLTIMAFETETLKLWPTFNFFTLLCSHSVVLTIKKCTDFFSLITKFYLTNKLLIKFYRFLLCHIIKNSVSLGADKLHHLQYKRRGALILLCKENSEYIRPVLNKCVWCGFFLNQKDKH